ncbi:MAG: 1,4-dihydroxy-2-naphthoate polyprenyltransferase [Bacteroidetes bacterium]|nr:MAG: 1,4-dihydroxy-2-naphthoate polyprenyltransferase [Bacteroidota bacterium]TAG89538.1 MAG: 1,4-dihydroxy-2-naphthoate polyprenyltransferase [Bacteroidota bacterium]
MIEVSSWLAAFRLRTLPLSLSSILMGSFLAQSQQKFDWNIFILTILTTILLQILSNLANDYGDFVNGADTDKREGEARMVATGKISATQMRNAIILFAIFSLISGLTLLYLAAKTWAVFWFFLGVGILSIVAAITYTVGKRPYGYMGLGDIAVFLFFGIVGVCGTYYLHTQLFDLKTLLPASACGLLATGVLNLNNMRDIQTDILAGKRTIPTRLGRKNATIYHIFLLVSSMILMIIYTFLAYQQWYQWIFLLILPLIYKNIYVVIYTIANKDLDPYLKQLAITSLLFVILFGLGNLI